MTVCRVDRLGKIAPHGTGNVVDTQNITEDKKWSHTQQGVPILVQFYAETTMTLESKLVYTENYW